MQFLETYHQHSCPILKAQASIYDGYSSLICRAGLAMESKVKAFNLAEIVEIGEATQKQGRRTLTL